MTEQALEKESLLLPKEKAHQLSFPANILRRNLLSKGNMILNEIDTNEINFNCCKYLLSGHYKQALLQKNMLKKAWYSFKTLNSS